MTLEPLTDQTLSEFFAYIDAHLKENGVDGTPLFQPQARSLNGFPEEKRDAFREGLAISVGAPKWRRVWLHRDADGRIAGHIDLRGRPEPFTSHRALLGMGLVRELRGKGLGLLMIEHVLRWATATNLIEVIDLDVLAHNEPALKLYRKAGFEFVARVEDMFRIDGNSEAQILMTKKL